MSIRRLLGQQRGKRAGHIGKRAQERQERPEKRARGGFRDRGASAYQHPVNVLEERAFDDLRVVEEEDRVLVLDARPLVELLEVLAEELRLVAAHDLDHEDLHAGDVRREPRERLPAGAADADEHRVAARHAEDALDAADVVDRVGEHDEPHRLHARLEVVLLELLLGYEVIEFRQYGRAVARCSHPRDFVLARLEISIRNVFGLERLGILRFAGDFEYTPAQQNNVLTDHTIGGINFFQQNLAG